MKELKERILSDGKCLPGGVLKVDNFINHQMDPKLMREMSLEFIKRFSGHKINKSHYNLGKRNSSSHHGWIILGRTCTLCKEEDSQYYGEYACHRSIFIHKEK